MWDDITLWFWFAFPWRLVMMNIFSCACWPSVCLGKHLLRLCAHIFKLDLFFVLSCMSAFYILDINPLLYISLANFFSHSVGWFFILLMVSLLCRSFLAWCHLIYLFLLLLILLLVSYFKNHRKDLFQGTYHLSFL